jgi:hypothetical protein
VISRQKCVGTVLLVVVLGFATACNKQEQQPDHGGPTPPPDNPDHKPLTNADWNVAISDANGVCYTNQNWVVTDPAKTISWSSTSGSQYIVEFSSPTPLTDAAGKAKYTVPVPSTGATAPFNIAKQATCTAGTISGCFYQYTIVKVAANPTNPGDYCGPSPMTVGIHIKP